MMMGKIELSCPFRFEQKEAYQRCMGTSCGATKQQRRIIFTHVQQHEHGALPYQRNQRNRDRHIERKEIQRTCN